MNRIKNPKKVVKLRFLDKSKIGNNCKILDGYFFSYEGQNKTKIIKLEKLGLIEVMDNKVYDFAHTSDPILLTYSNEKICTKGPRREELFELIPNNSNLIIELRSPEHIVNHQCDSIYMKHINIFLNDIFVGLNKIFKDFLEWNEIIPSSQSPSPSQSHSRSPSRSPSRSRSRSPSQSRSRSRSPSQISNMFRHKIKHKKEKRKTKRKI